MPQPKKKDDVSARRRKMQQKGKIPWSYVVPVLVILLVIVGLIFIETRTTAADTTTATGTQAWPYACLSGTSLFEHIHPWLRIWVDGANVTIPAAVGAQDPGYGGGQVISSSCYMPMHTHDSSGIIHIESTTNTNYTLANFFSIWNVSYAWVSIFGQHHPIEFNSTDIFGLSTNSTYSLKILVDGNSIPTSQFNSLALNALDYCSAKNSASTSSPCNLTASGSDPLWNGGQTTYPYGTNHTIIIEYGKTGQSFTSP